MEWVLGVVEFTGPGRQGDLLLIARRNNSLSTKGGALALGSLLVVSLTISLPFAFLGAWLILPFAGLDVFLVFLAFRYIEHRKADFESITIEGDRLVVEKWEAGVVSRAELSTYWVRVLWRPDEGRQGALLLGSHGRVVPFGAHLTRAQKHSLAQTLQRRLRDGGAGTASSG